MKKILYLLLLLICSSCAVAPFNTTSTARSLGKDQNQIKGNFPVLGIMYERGLSKDLDIGVAIEEQTAIVLNAFTKYAFINKAEEGFSLAAIVGGGYSSAIGQSKSFYAGPVLSYRFGNFEPFITYRKNFVSWKSNLSPSDQDNLLKFIPRKAHFNYDQLDFGGNIINDKWTVTIGLKAFLFKNGEGTGSPFADIAFKF